MCNSAADAVFFPVMTADLSLRLRTDMEGSFGELVADYRQAVYTTALRVSGCPEDAADMAAEAFLRAYAALRGYSAERIGDLRLRPWLITIVLNVARNAARTASRRPTQIGLDPCFDPVDQRERPEDEVFRHDGQARLGGLLSELPDTQRIAVVLRHVVGLPYAEMAEVMGCPEGTAKSHVTRGLAGLRTRIAEEGR